MCNDNAEDGHLLDLRPHLLGVAAQGAKLLLGQVPRATPSLGVQKAQRVEAGRDSSGSEVVGRAPSPGPTPGTGARRRCCCRPSPRGTASPTRCTGPRNERRPLYVAVTWAVETLRLMDTAESGNARESRFIIAAPAGPRGHRTRSRWKLRCPLGFTVVACWPYFRSAK